MIDGWMDGLVRLWTNRRIEWNKWNGTEVEVKEILRSLLLITTICGVFVLMVLWIDWT